jgi:hypothetical protein
MDRYEVSKAMMQSSAIARSGTTKQSVLAVCEIATGVRPRNDSRILRQRNNSEMKYAPVRGRRAAARPSGTMEMPPKTDSSAVNNCLEGNKNE